MMVSLWPSVFDVLMAATSPAMSPLAMWKTEGNVRSSSVSSQSGRLVAWRRFCFRSAKLVERDRSRRMFVSFGSLLSMRRHVFFYRDWQLHQRNARPGWRRHRVFWKKIMSWTGSTLVIVGETFMSWFLELVRGRFAKRSFAGVRSEAELRNEGRENEGGIRRGRSGQATSGKRL